ncbi:nucleolar complex protein 2 [Ceratobasidium sp. AG-Ba]|nr:nucleolar complex protein 2 [Ceratobasidium sp. AG-Ba]QRV99552.1 nucleolar complex protein 2 [Ceratobasidium sp. AG-Ba]
MGKKASKATRKFAASGELKRTITARRKHKAVKQKAQVRSAEKEKKRKQREEDESEDEQVVQETRNSKGKGKAKTVDDLLSGAFLDEDDDSDAIPEGEEGEEVDVEQDDSDDDEGIADDESFASLDEEDEGAAHAMDLAALKKSDPEFYKYLQENDKELLDFNASDVEFSAGEDEDEDEDGMDEDKAEEDVPLLTVAMLKDWQRSLIETHSLRALRRLLIAFRSAAHMNDEDVKTAWRIDSAVVFNKLVTTALKYTPIIAAHHMPYKTLPNGKFKPPASTSKTASLSKLLLSQVQTAVHLIEQLPSNPITKQKPTEEEDEGDSETEERVKKGKKGKGKKGKGKQATETDEDEGKTALVELALSETAKLAPYIVGSRKTIKLWLKTCLNLWSSAADSVRISAFLAIRRLAFSSDEGIVDLVQKNTYLTLLRTSKSSSQHTLPSLTLMKNSASELYALDRAAAYTTAFGYIRQLAVHLRTSTKVKTKEAYKQVYNWQFVHCVDFWSLVLARGCEDGDEESELKPLVYPLVQIGLGAVGLIPSARYHPFHLHILRSLHYLASHTNTYIPIPAHILPILTSHLVPISGKPKTSSGGILRPLDLASTIRAPAQYVKTHILAESIVTEAVLLMAESVPARSVAFPEVVVPLTSTLRRALKRSSASANAGRSGKKIGVSGKVVSSIKALVEHLEESSKWTSERRMGLQYAPAQWGEVSEWERSVKPEGTPVGKWVGVLRKQREARRKLVESGGGMVDA